jgi:hypothetical protein
VAVAVAKFTETGGGSQTPGAMYTEFKSYIDDDIAIDSTQWKKAFLDQTGKNVNTAINGVAKLLGEFEMN